MYGRQIFSFAARVKKSLDFFERKIKGGSCSFDNL